MAGHGMLRTLARAILSTPGPPASTICWLHRRDAHRHRPYSIDSPIGPSVTAHPRWHSCQWFSRSGAYRSPDAPATGTLTADRLSACAVNSTRSTCGWPHHVAGVEFRHDPATGFVPGLLLGRSFPPRQASSKRRPTSLIDSNEGTARAIPADVIDARCPAGDEQHPACTVRGRFTISGTPL